MNTGTEEWQLSGLQRFLGEIRQRLESGGIAVVAPDDSRPRGLRLALLRLGFSIEKVDPLPGQPPGEALAEPYGAAPSIQGLVGTALNEDTALVRMGRLTSADARPWLLFLDRLAALRGSIGGLRLILVDPPAEIARKRDALDWRDYLGRGDRLIWAERHLPESRNGLAGEIAVHQAVELCGWRLDLARSLVQARIEDLADPIAWIGRDGRGTASPVDRERADECPLVLLSRNERQKLELRVWRAQLAAIFPWLEDCRLEIIASHRGKLRVDEHLRSIGVSEVEQIELGALAWQLSGKLDRKAADEVQRLARMRNALAHRTPVEPDDLRACWNQPGARVPG